MITLTRTAATETPAGNKHVWPLQVTAVSNTPGLSSEIFVYHADAGGETLSGDIFECVASVSQMDDIGLAADFVSDPAIPYYRSDTLEFNCRSAHDLENVWLKLQQDVAELYANFMSANNMTSEETVVIP